MQQILLLVSLAVGALDCAIRLCEICARRGNRE
jgi:hypothetical protein